MLYHILYIIFLSLVLPARQAAYSVGWRAEVDYIPQSGTKNLASGFESDGACLHAYVRRTLTY
jgi:hypothetical protein